MPSAARVRDGRVDVLRGAALLMIFVDHIPGNVLNSFTLHNIGFCDAAEIFVLLAGFSSMMAYGAKFDRDGMGWPTLRRILARCARIYVVQAVLLLVTVLVAWRWSEQYRMPDMALMPLLQQGLEGIARALTLRALPGYIDILPLYIVLLAVFPLIYLAMRRHIALALGISALIWVAANLDHRLNLPNSMDGNGWYFNPFTWQLLFTTGAAVAVLMARRGGLLPRHKWLAALCWAYLAFAFLQGATWADWHLPSLQLFDMAPPDKSHLSPLRILDVLALLYLVMSSPWVSRLMKGRAVGLLAVCGKHSLEVFAVGCAGALLGRLMFSAHGTGFWMQVAINGLGIGAMLATALALEQNGGKQRAAASAQKMIRHQDVSFQQAKFGVYRA